MRTIYRLLFQREFNTDLYYENHLSSSFSEWVQYCSIQWEPIIVFFFRESTILTYTMRTIYRLIFQREFNTDLYNENHLSSSFSERVQYWSILWEPFIVFFFWVSSIHTMRTNYRLLFQREFNTDLYNENHLSSSFSERVQYWSIQWEPFIVLFQREFNTDLYNENHLLSSFSERVQYWSILWEPFIILLFQRESSILIYTMRTIYLLLFQREFNTDLYNENHLSSFFFRESSILIYTMRTIYRLLFQREFNTDLYNENHLSSSFSERVQYWSIQWEPFISFFFRESSILIYTMRTIYLLLFQREFNTDLYMRTIYRPSFSERVQYWSIQWEPILYYENHLSSSFSEWVQYWSIQWEPIIVFFFRESTILTYTENHLSPYFSEWVQYWLYNENHLSSSFSERVQYWSISMRTIYRLLFQREFNTDLYNENHLSSFFQREFNTDLYNENHLSSSFSERVQYWSIQWEPFIVFFFRESSILIYTMRTIYLLLFQREFNTDLYNENHLSSSFSERVQYWSIQWEPFIVFFFRESLILIYIMRTICHLLFQRESSILIYTMRTIYLLLFSERVQYWPIQWEPFISLFFKVSSILIYTMRTIYCLLFQREYNMIYTMRTIYRFLFSERVQYWSIQ